MTRPIGPFAFAALLTLVLVGVVLQTRDAYAIVPPPCTSAPAGAGNIGYKITATFTVGILPAGVNASGVCFTIPGGGTLTNSPSLQSNAGGCGGAGIIPSLNANRTDTASMNWGNNAAAHCVAPGNTVGIWFLSGPGVTLGNAPGAANFGGSDYGTTDAYITLAPDYQPVGGLSLDPQLPGSSGSDAWLAAALAGAMAVVVITGGGVWYARMRRVR
jgi:hypothetical protein